jgi:(1->4)-alpha-D-glucan 1-alpha-D-glucosylmutase
MKPADIPVATYRLQFNKDFGFAAASAIVPYLHRLGISHIYASPYLKARAGSPHGYDIVDHERLNPEIGSDDDFAHLVRTLHGSGMGQVLDIVPNHMGVGGSDNAWWLDVLEHGEASDYNHFFDIEWQPPKLELQQKVLLPFLGEHYGVVLERGELKLCYVEGAGALRAEYYEHVFPLDVRTYPQVLDLALEMARKGEAAAASIARLEALAQQCRSVPRRNEPSRSQRRQRRQLSTACKEQLHALCTQESAVAAAVQQAVDALNGTAGEPDTFDRLHRLLESQAFRLCYWQVASHEINYRRFFDINSLAGIRVEDPEVFERTHRRIGELVRTGSVTGLRIDHPDGLSDPGRYCADLQRYLREIRGEPSEQPLYLVLEKILARHERMPPDWPTHGSTGYEFSYLLNGLFVDPMGEAPLNRLYSRFTGLGTDFDALLYDRKKLIIRSTLTSELTVLANLLSGIAENDRRTRDFTYQGLRDALAEVTACFPVYRTYINDEGATEKDRQHVQWAIAQAKHHSPAGDHLIFDFIEHVLLEGPRHPSQRQRQRVLRFVRRLQQYTAPVMAKGMEDTAFYAYNRLVSLNDVGFDARTFGISLTAFHQDNRQRLSETPYTMVATSTHDSKRGEDVRARINLLSEIPELWQRHLSRWQRVNRSKKKLAGTQPAPTANDEYLLYQTLFGSWPTEHEPDLSRYRDRVEEYMIKAIREAKVRTSWINPSEEYESAMRHFIRALLDEGEHNPFLADFVPFQRDLVRLGLCNSLSQTLLKLTVPGVPDIYQGNELYCFSLTDPDNRRPVDFTHRGRLLDQLLAEADSGNGNGSELARRLLGDAGDGRAKLFLTWRTLQLRQRWRELFQDGDYVPLATGGTRADHVCAFVRTDGARSVLVAAPRLYAGLLGTDAERLPLGEDVWQDTWIALPEQPQVADWFNVFTRRPVEIHHHEGGAALRASALFADFCPALLASEAV